MYFIQGADQKQYGPISAEQLRQWIAENRLNRTSPCRAEAEETWKTLGDFPEFADAFGTVPPATPQYSPSPGPLGSDPSAEVRGPAIGILVTGILGALMSLLGLVMNLAGMNKNQEVPPGFPAEYRQMFESYMQFVQQYGSISNVVVLALSVVTILAGVRMMQLRSYGLVMAGVILSMIPCCSGCCCLGIPFGIWALVVLNRPSVKASFH
jgi:hypothetical protein